MKAEQRNTVFSEDQYRKRKAATSIMNRTQHNFRRKQDFLPDEDPCLTSKELAIHSPIRGMKNLSPTRLDQGTTLFNSFTLRKNRIK